MDHLNDIDKYVRELVLAAPPLTDDKRSLITALLTNENRQTVAAA